MQQFLAGGDIGIEVVCYLGYLWAAEKFCKKYLGGAKRNGLLFVVFSFGGWLFLEMVNGGYDVPYIFLMMSSHIVFAGMVLLLFRGGWEKKVLAASILMAVRTLAGNFCESFVSCLVLFFRHRVGGEAEVFLDGWEAGLPAYASFVTVILAVCLLSGHLAPVFSDKPGKWYVILAVPLLAAVAVIDVVNWGAANGIMVKGGRAMGVYYDQIFSHAEICVLAGLSMAAVGFYMFGMARIYREQEKSSRYSAQIAVYKMLGEQYRQSERLRHDMKNHIIALSGLFQGKEWEKMGSYLKNLEESCLEAGGDMTGNKAVDALLYQKWKRVEVENISWECDVQIPKACSIDAFDLCILFGNILDNALEACERLCCSGRCPEEGCFINIEAKAVKKCFLIEVKNSMDVSEKWKEGHTDKDNPQEHGIGLWNVRDVVKKYDGAISIEARNGIFVVSILIPLNGAVHDIKQAV